MIRLKSASSRVSTSSITPWPFRWRSSRRAWRRPENWTALHRETRDHAFELVLDHQRAVDPEKVRAELRDGVLRVVLPKVEALQPRKIAVA